jgi:hypothetical protein
MSGVIILKETKLEKNDSSFIIASIKLMLNICVVFMIFMVKLLAFCVGISDYLIYINDNLLNFVEKYCEEKERTRLSIIIFLKILNVVKYTAKEFYRFYRKTNIFLEKMCTHIRNKVEIMNNSK